MNHSSAAHPHASYTDVLKKELFDTCAGVTLPYRGQRVYYFPQGHIEQLGGPMDVGKELLFELPPKILCEVNNVKYMAERETDQISVEITLFPLTAQGEVPSPNPQFLATEMSAVRSFCRTLTASDISKHGTLFINMCDAKNFLPPLEMSQGEEPHQYLVATDLQGKDWRFKHVFKGTPKRHLLTRVEGICQVKKTSNR
ncbi:auxin response factor 1 isoform X5 [Manihot esculenta]|uniref:auxin response factor 1 isoform X5 n=1 Tax=Manihot esculenta TaxID=3983 RepID=UPI001CC6B05A|nr:auxin response factor 1 isoform X5 [Manihot esculenta]